MSNIDPSKPTEGQATTSSVRQNFQVAADEIDALVVVDEGQAAEIAALQPGGAQAFAAYLAGYEDTGLHAQFAGDLDTILINSSYSFDGGSVTNKPADMGNVIGQITTYIYYLRDEWAMQVIYATTGGEFIWMRNRASNTWGAWKLVVDGGAFTQRLAGYADDQTLLRITGDLDSLVRSATYSFAQVEVTNAPVDLVSGINFIHIYVVEGDTSNVTQVIYGQQNDPYKMWIRTRRSLTWQAWKLVVDGSTTTRTGSVLTMTNVPVV